MQEQVDERVSARFEKAMMDEIDRHVKKEGYANRSEFLRMAARALLDAQEHEDSVAVEISPLLNEFISTMVDRGYYRSQAHALQIAVDSFFTEERIREIFKAARSMEVVAGKKVEAELDNRTSRQIIRP